MEHLKTLDIFIVDDEPAIVDQLYRIVSKKARTVKKFLSAKDALDAFIASKPHFILSDIRMPEMNGIEFCKEIKKLDPKVPVAFLSATDDREHLIEAINAGSNYFLSKPIEVEKLNETLKKISQNIALETLARKQQEFLDKELKIKTNTILEQNIILDQIQKAISHSFLFRQIDKNGKLIYANDNFKNLFNIEDIAGVDAYKNRFFSLEKEEIKLDKITDDNQISLYDRCYKIADRDLFIKSTTIALPSSNNLLEISCDVTKTHELANQLLSVQEKIVFTLGNIVESRSEETSKHVERVANYAYIIARRCGIDSAKLDLLKAAAPLHDIGKIAIDDAILKKPAKLTDIEMQKMRTHTTVGYDLLKNTEGEVFEVASKIALMHHEKWDGTGYPNALAKEKIDLNARVVAIADVFDAISSKRVYKDAWSLDDAINYIISEKGRSFDPELIDAFYKELDTIKDIYHNL